MNEQDKITAAIIIIGDEILSGRTPDQNTAHIASHLSKIGISLSEVRIIADIEAKIVSTVNELRPQFDYIFTTGGIGPTHDDITADSIARAFGVSIEIDERAVEMMRARYREEELVGERMRMARLPKGSELIGNPISHTPGFMIGNVIVMAGIPAIMQVMLDHVTPCLRKGLPFFTRTIQVLVPESEIATILRSLQSEFSDLALGSYPFFENNQLGAHLVLRSTSNDLLDKASEELLMRLQKNKLNPRLINN